MTVVEVLYIRHEIRAVSLDISRAFDTVWHPAEGGGGEEGGGGGGGAHFTFAKRQRSDNFTRFLNLLNEKHVYG